MQWLSALNDVDLFDPELFRMTRREAELADPQLRILLELAWRAQEDAGYATSLPRNAGVFIGASFFDYAGLLTNAGVVDGHKSAGNAPSMLANRLSRAFRLTGPSICLDTACSSGLVALDQACRALIGGEIDAALVGGIGLVLSPSNMADWQAAGMLSPEGRCRSFSGDANGYGVGEGGVVLVLKALASAERDGDPIRGVILGSASGHDGGDNIGVAAPSTRAQVAVIRAALKAAACDPDMIDAVEAHGTGTLLGDPVEWSALAEVFRNRSEQRPACLITAAKSVFGHIGPAAGLLGAASALLAMQHETLPGVRNLRELNPHLAYAPHLSLLDGRRSWPRGRASRRIGVSAMGFGGVNAHVVLTDADVNVPSSPLRPGPLILVFGAQDFRRRQALAGAYLACLQTLDETGARNLCATSVYTGHRGHAQAAIVAWDVSQLCARLLLMAQRTADVADLSLTGIFLHPESGIRETEQGSPPHGPECEFQERVQLYLRGATVGWTDVYPTGTWRRVALPSYPMRKARYWAVDSSENDLLRKGSADCSRENQSGLFAERVWTPASSSRDLPQKARGSKFAIVGAPARSMELLRKLSKEGATVRLGDSLEHCAPTECLVVVEPDHPAILVEAVRQLQPRQCILVTRNAQSVSATELAMYPMQAASWGAIEALRKESPLVSFRAIDTDARFEGLLAVELMADTSAPHVGLRGETRHVLTEVPQERPNDPPVLLRRGGKYMIVGGTGGIGSLLAPWLRQRYNAQLFLVGQRRPEGVQPPINAAVWFGDLADANNCADAIAAADQALGGLDGIFHLAGHFDPVRISTVERAQFDAALAAKLGVGIALDEALGSRTLDFVVVFGSLASYSAFSGSAAYSAADRALAAFCAGRRTAGRPYVALMWPGWRGVGMGQRVLDTDRPLEPKHALSLIEAALGLGIREVLMARSSPLHSPIAQTSSTAVAGDIAALIAKHLGVEQSALHASTFVDLGLDSMGARTLARVVGQAVKTILSPTIFFNQPTLRELLAYFGIRGGESTSSATQPERTIASHDDRLNDAGEIGVVGMACRFPNV
jgi:3-oxoacyl-(acyl-carrier-protein) synthase